jgi:type I restriction enzyme M protein
VTLEEIQEQDYLLNPERYVGMVIEKDSMTGKEFGEEIIFLNNSINALNS